MQPFYIGIGALRRAYGKSKRSNHWNYIIKKAKYEVEILFSDLTWKLACDKEKEFIKLYGRCDNGTGILVNHTDGGEGSIGVIQSKEANEKRRIWSSNRRFSKETLELFSKLNKGDKNPMYNRTGVNSPSFGIKRSLETRLKISNNAKLRIGKKNPMYGKKHSDETKEKIRQSRLGKTFKHTKKIKEKIS
jgi:hypothetical protein